MRCEECDNASRWLDDDGDWTRVVDAPPAGRQKVECDVCGARQWVR